MRSQLRYRTSLMNLAVDPKYRQVSNIDGTNDPPLRIVTDGHVLI
jgi:hypothetical protein